MPPALTAATAWLILAYPAVAHEMSAPAARPDGET
jgi:hypothetical protein